MGPDTFDSTIALWLVDVAIAITLVEGVAMAWWYRRTGAGIGPRRLWCNLAAGLALMAALRAALAGFGWPWVAAGLMLAGVAHALDQVERWRRLAADGARRRIETAPVPAPVPLPVPATVPVPVPTPEGSGTRTAPPAL